jgi:hypothetical protein
MEAGAYEAIPGQRDKVLTVRGGLVTDPSGTGDPDAGTWGRLDETTGTPAVADMPSAKADLAVHRIESVADPAIARTPDIGTASWREQCFLEVGLLPPGD